MPSLNSQHLVLTLAEAVQDVEPEVREGGERGVDQLQHGLQPPAVLAQHADALPVLGHVLPDVVLHRGRVCKQSHLVDITHNLTSSISM